MSKKNMNVDVRSMSIDEIHRISEIDVSESGSVVYKWVEGVVKPVAEEWRRPASYGKGWEKRVDLIRKAMQKGGIALGAFDGGRLVGFVALQYRLDGDISDIPALWISAAYRRHGIASRLLHDAIQAARGKGAKAVYASTCPSESAMGFYRKQGFVPAVFVHRELYELEPEDIHMILNL